MSLVAFALHEAQWKAPRLVVLFFFFCFPNVWI